MLTALLMDNGATSVRQAPLRIDLSFRHMSDRFTEIYVACLGLLRNARRALNELDGLI